MRKLAEDARIPASNCPTCGYRMDCATGLEEGTQPSPGAISICMKCGELLLFDEDLTMRRPTVPELVDIQTSQSWPEIERARAAIKRLHQRIARGELPPFGQKKGA